MRLCMSHFGLECSGKGIVVWLLLLLVDKLNQKQQQENWV